MEITENEKGALLLAARHSIKNFFDKTKSQQIDYKIYPNLKLHLGAFVTLKINNELRGCIGYVFTKMTLYDTVCEAAKQAAFSDPRFFPMTIEELEFVKIEISVLSYPEKISSYDEIIIGRHGLMLEERYVKAVLLPQVAISNNFNREDFLSAICEKGGLPLDTWKIKKLNLLVFTATIFSDENND